MVALHRLRGACALIQCCHGIPAERQCICIAYIFHYIVCIFLSGQSLWSHPTPPPPTPPFRTLRTRRNSPDCTGCLHFRGPRCTMEHSESFQCRVSLFRGVGDSWVLIRGELHCKHYYPINASNELNFARWAFCGFCKMGFLWILQDGPFVDFARWAFCGFCKMGLLWILQDGPFVDFVDWKPCSKVIKPVKI